MERANVVNQWGLITRAVFGAQRRALEDIEASGLPAQWFAALHLLLATPEHRLPMSHIARDLHMTAGGFTKLADRLGREGLIDRRNAAGDRRIIYAVLTDKGAAVGREAAVRFEAAIDEHVVSLMGQARLADVAAALSALDGIHPVEPDRSIDAINTRDPQMPERREFADADSDIDSDAAAHPAIAGPRP